MRFAYGELATMIKCQYVLMMRRLTDRLQVPHTALCDRVASYVLEKKFRKNMQGGYYNI